jgi:hypothetical protein
MDKLSTLIREGAAKRPQVFYQLIAPVGDGNYGTCALGAALDAVGYEMFGEDPTSEELVTHIGLELVAVASPAHPGLERPLIDVIINLNDHERWSREQIADWLESIGR